MSITLIDANEVTDGSGHALVSKLNVKMPILMVSRVENLLFNESIGELANKPYCLINFTELGWNYDFSKGGHKWGVNTQEFDFMQSTDWKRLDNFIACNPPAISLVRDLLQEDVTENVLPIVYPCFLPPEPLQTKEEFDKRVFEVIFAWGLSHEYRKTLHAKIWEESGRYGYSVCDNLFNFGNFILHEGGNKKWLTLNIPHYSRLPMEEFIKINGCAKISVSIAGAGRTCFRHAESPINSVMLMWEDKIAWPEGMEWINNQNCIKCEQGNEIETLVEALQNPNLYEIYKNGVQNVDRFRFANYVPYLENLINKV